MEEWVIQQACCGEDDLSASRSESVSKQRREVSHMPSLTVAIGSDSNSNSDSE
jgi:hypothetical protein